MFVDPFEFIWDVPVSGHGYVWAKCKLPYHPPFQGLVPLDDAQFRPRALLRADTALYLELADTPPTLEGAQSFANRYGRLGITDSIHNPATVTPAPGVSGG